MASSVTVSMTVSLTVLPFGPFKCLSAPCKGHGGGRPGLTSTRLTPQPGLKFACANLSDTSEHIWTTGNTLTTVQLALKSGSSGGISEGVSSHGTPGNAQRPLVCQQELL